MISKSSLKFYLNFKEQYEMIRTSNGLMVKSTHSMEIYNMVNHDD